MDATPTTTLALVLTALACGCGARARDVARVTTTSSAEEGRTRSASSRTIDNAGFVDNAGRTSTETARTDLSGMRATEVGSERVTGTPGTGAPVPPFDPTGPGARATEGEGAGASRSQRGTSGPPASGAPPETVVGRVAQARCDQATTCGRSTSTEACMMPERPKARADVERAACPNGIDTVQLGLCLASIRQLDCGARAGALDDVEACRASALCAPR